LGFDWEANSFFYFIADVGAAADDLQIMYGIGGERELEDHTLERLNGYQNARPVRIGNAAYRQDQHDVWGTILDSVYLHTKSRDLLPERVWAPPEAVGGERHRTLAGARPRHLGGPRGAAALHVLEADVLGGV
jgi:GH15 family glucan-1,4-alpha-glucosidase